MNGSLWIISLEFTCYLSVLALGIVGANYFKKFWLAITTLIFVAVVFQKMGLFSHLLTLTRLASFFFAGGVFFLYERKVKYIASFTILPLSYLYRECFFHVGQN